MIDYADFNKQHTLEAQSIVFESLANRYRDVNANLDLIRSAEWCAKALLNQWCLFPQDDRSVKITQGLFSGGRATSFLNTILNVAYYKVAEVQAEKQLLLVPINLYRVHQGDDVWISNDSRLWATAVYNMMRNMGFEFQPSKQLFDDRRGEYLRVLYTEKGTRGYLGRATVGLLIRPLQSASYLSPQEKAASLNDQICTLYRRKLSAEACEILWYAIVPHALKSKTFDNEVFSIPWWVAVKPMVSGGLGIAPPTMACLEVAFTPPIPPFKLEATQLAKILPSYMSKSFVAKLSEEYKESINSRKLVDILKLANVSDSLTAGDRAQGVRRLSIDIRDWKEKLEPIPIKMDHESWQGLWTALLPDERMLESLKVLREINSPKVALALNTRVGVILQAIITSPFVNITTAKICLGCGTKEAVSVCIETSTNLLAIESARSAWSGITSVLNPEIIDMIMDPSHGPDSWYKSRLHPILLSHVYHMAVDRSVEMAVQVGTWTGKRYRQEVVYNFNRMIAAVAQDGQLFQLSHY